MLSCLEISVFNCGLEDVCAAEIIGASNKAAAKPFMRRAFMIEVKLSDSKLLGFCVEKSAILKRAAETGPGVVEFSGSRQAERRGSQCAHKTDLRLLRRLGELRRILRIFVTCVLDRDFRHAAAHIA